MATLKQPTVAQMKAEEQKWQAQTDARTLASAEEIKTYSGRMNRAKVQARQMVAEEQKKLKGLQKISGSPKKTTKKKGSKKK